MRVPFSFIQILVHTKPPTPHMDSSPNVATIVSPSQTVLDPVEHALLPVVLVFIITSLGNYVATQPIIYFSRAHIIARMIFTHINGGTKACFLQSSTLEAILKVGIKGIVNTIEALYCLVEILTLGKKAIA